MALVKAPWTDEQVKNLNAWQTCGGCHPFTCGGTKNGQDCRSDLVATNAGWTCPDGCGYTQDWAHDFMLDGKAVQGWEETIGKRYREAREKGNSDAV